jgi:hypothetical protein
MAGQRLGYLQWAILAAGAVAVACLVWFYLIPAPEPREPTIEELREALQNGPSGGTAEEVAQARADAADRLGTLHEEDLRQAQAAGSPEEKRQAEWEAIVRAEPTLALLFAAMDDESSLVRSRAGVAVSKIIKADYGFRADDPPAKRRALLKGMKRDRENCVKALEKLAKGAKSAPRK